MPEEQELKLSVTIDDQASAQLGRLQQTLLGLASAGQNTSGMNQFAQGLRGASQHAQNLHGGLMGMAAKGGLVGGFFFEVGRQVHQMAEEFVKAVLDIKKYSDEMVRLDQNAQRAATSMAQFRANTAVFRESGIAAREAEGMLKGYAGALANLQRPGSAIRQELLQSQRGESRQLMQDLIRNVEGGTQEQGIEAIRAHGRRIREFHESQGKGELGAQAEATFYARLGMPGLEKVRGQLREVTAAEKQMYKDRDVDTKRFQTALEKQAEAGDNTVKALQSIAFQILPINAASETLAHWWELIQKSAEAYDRNLRRAKITMDNMPGGIGEGGWFPTAEQVLARIRKQAAGNIVLNPPPVDQAPGGGVYGSDIEEDVPRTPLPGEKPIPQDWIDQARKEQAAKPNKNTAPGLRQKTPGTRRTNFLDTGDGGGGADAGGVGSDLQRVYESNIEQIDELTEEFRKLNYFFQTAELSGLKPGSILAGGGGGRPGGGGGTPGGGGRPGGGGGGDGSSNPPAQSQNPPATQTASAPPAGPYGQPMPPWGATTTGPADFGGGTGGGVAGGVQGAPGGPSGRALTKEERAAGGAVGTGGAAPAAAAAGGGGAAAAPGAPLKPGPGGKVAGGEAAVQARMEQIAQAQGLVGHVPVDGEKYGIKTGSAAEWGAFLTNLAKGESSFKTKEHGDVGQFGGAGSRGLFQLSPNDATTYGLRDKPYTIAELEDPDFNANVAAQIVRKLSKGEGPAAKVGVKGLQEGASLYFGGNPKYTKGGQSGPLYRGGYKVRPDQLSGRPPPDAAPPAASGAQPPGAPVTAAPAASGTAQPLISEVQRSQAQHRPYPITDELRSQLEYASAVSGVRGEVYSGGQEKPFFNPKTGKWSSHRHDITKEGKGQAADLRLYDGKRLLNSDNPADREKIKAFITAAVNAGATGIGHGPGYMGTGSVHIGGGSATSWGGTNWLEQVRRLAAANRISPQERDRIIAEAKAKAANQAKGVPPPPANPPAPSATTPNAQPPGTVAPPSATTPSYRNPATSLYERLSEQERNRPGAPIQVSGTTQQPGPGSIGDITGPREGAIVVPGTSLRAGKPPAPAPSTLDLSTIDSAPDQNTVDVKGQGHIRVDVKGDSAGTPSKKDEPLTKTVSISKQTQMTPATPTGSESNAEE